MDRKANGDRIRVALLSAHALLRASIARLLAQDPDFELAGDCGTAGAGLRLVCEQAVDIVLVDFDGAAREAFDRFIPSARAAGYRGRFLAVAGTMSMIQEAATALNQGASGVLLKSDPPDVLLQAIRHVAAGALWLHPTILQRLAGEVVTRTPQRAGSGAAVTANAREREVLLGVMAGLTNRRIAEKLGVSEGTVKNVLQVLFTRAGVRSRSQLVRLALEGSSWKTGLAPAGSG